MKNRFYKFYQKDCTEGLDKDCGSRESKEEIVKKLLVARNE